MIWTASFFGFAVFLWWWVYMPPMNSIQPKKVYRKPLFHAFEYHKVVRPPVDTLDIGSEEEGIGDGNKI